MQTAQPETVGLSSARLARLDAALQGYVDRGELAGVISLLARRGQLVHASCCGWADIAARRPLEPDALFRMFSFTKSVTTVALMMLYEEGRFHLSDPVARFIPAFGDSQVFVGQTDAGLELAPMERPITLHDLLLHTSGLAYGLFPTTPVEALYQEAGILRMDEPLVEKVPRVATLPLAHQPGKGWTYSVGIDVVGHIVELVSGQPLDVFMRERIFEPLGMVDTDFYAPPEKQERLATLYVPGPGGGLLDVTAVPEANRPPFLVGAWVDKTIKPAFLSGGGGLVSTAADCLRYAMMLLGHGELDGARLLGRKTVELMTQNHLPPELPLPAGVGLGLGVTVVTDMARACIPCSTGSYGAGGAAGTEFWVDPQEEMAGVLMLQYVSDLPRPVNQDFRVLAAQAIVD